MWGGAGPVMVLVRVLVRPELVRRAGSPGPLGHVAQHDPVLGNEDRLGGFLDLLRGDGEPLSSTKVVVLSPPHPAIATAVMLANTPTANRFMSPLNVLPMSPVTPTIPWAAE